MAQSNKNRVKWLILTNAQICFFILSAVALSAALKLGHIQFSQAEYWADVAEKRGLRFRNVEATRGNILADNGTLLSTSIPFYKLIIDPTVASDKVFDAGIDSLSLLLSKYFNENSKAYYKNLLKRDRKNNKKYRIISSKLIKHKDKKIIESTWPILREGRNRGGVIFEKEESRFKPFGDLARRTVGFLRDSEEGKTIGKGLEYSFNTELEGLNGQALYKRIAGGRWIPVDEVAAVRSEDGYDIKTTIDIDIQEYAHDVLYKALQKHDANFGSFILMEVNTGQIKSIVNLGKSRNGKYYEDYNYAIQLVTEPGSTMKLASFLALLEDGEVSLEDSIDTGNGKYEFYEGAVMKDATAYGYGKLSVEQVFEKSSNVGTSLLVDSLFKSNPDKFIKYLKDLHLVDPLGFQMKGEGISRISTPDDESWSGTSLPWMSIGYELAVTPLQVLTLYNAVANDGKMLQPYIVKEVLQGNHTIEEFGTTVLDNEICSSSTLEDLQRILIGVVENGTARNIRSEDYMIAGKTGTSQKVKSGRYTKNYFTSFAGYFPADNPKYSAIVVIDEPRGDEQYGGTVCAPIFKEIADRVVIKHIDRFIEEDENLEMKLPYIQAGNAHDLKLLAGELNLKTVNQNKSEWLRTEVQGDTIVWKDNLGGHLLVPDTRGMTLRDAIFLLENQSMKVKVQGEGRVQTQSVTPGTKVTKGREIMLRLGRG